MYKKEQQTKFRLVEQINGILAVSLILNPNHK